MKILTVRGQDSSGKTTMLALGSAMLLRKQLSRQTEKPRVLLVCKSQHAVKHLLRVFSEASESLGMVGDVSGEHGCFVLHTISLDMPQPALQQAYDYVIADVPNWPQVFGWARRNQKNIRHLIASEDAHSSDYDNMEQTDVAA